LCAPHRATDGFEPIPTPRADADANADADADADAVNASPLIGRARAARRTIRY